MVVLHGSRLPTPPTPIDRLTPVCSVVGQNCVVGNQVKLVNSVLMDRVTVEDGCTVQNCILCSGCHLQVLAPTASCCCSESPPR